MAIHIQSGDILKAPVEAIVNPINTAGVMGAGLARQVRDQYPDHYAAYREACRRGEVRIGRMFVHDRGEGASPRYIIGFPTKTDWRLPSKVELRTRLDEARRKEAELQRKLSEAYERIRTLEARLSAETIVAATPRPEDRRRHRYKALIAALRADVERLEAALRKAGVREEIVVEEETPPPAETVVDVEAALAGKTILVVGGDRAPETEKPVRILHHPGYTKEGLEHLINMADVVAIVTRHISHGLFWYVRDEALERDKPVVYTTHTNGDLILRAVAGRILSGR